MNAEPGSPLARARMRAHQTFDRFWQSGQMSRSQAYRWLAGELGISKDQCHMLQFDIPTCQKVVAICSQRAFREEPVS